jgi:hypothetical protein
MSYRFAGFSCRRRLINPGNHILPVYWSRHADDELELIVSCCRLNPEKLNSKISRP